MKFFLLLLLLELSLFASIGKISALNGKIVVDRQKQLLDAVVGFDLEEKDLVITDDKSKAQITLNDGTVLSLGKNSKLDINEYVYDEKDSSNSKADFKFAEGTFKSITGAIGKVSPEKFKLETKSASIGIRGTIVVGSQEKIACTHGKITVTAGGVTQFLNAGMMTNTEMGKPPTPPTKIEGNMLNEVSDTSNSEDSSTKETSNNQSSENSNTNSETNSNNQSSNTSQQNINTTQTTTISASFADVSNNTNNTALKAEIDTSTVLVSEEARKKAAEVAASLPAEEARKKAAETSTNIPFYSSTVTIDSDHTVGSKIFTVPTGGTTVTIATYGPSLGMDPVLILLKKNADGSYIYVNADDDSWTKAGSAENSILSLTLSEGVYKVAVSDYSFNINDEINNQNNGEGTLNYGHIDLYFSSTASLSFEDTTISKYSNSNSNLAYIQDINYSSSKIDTNKLEFNALADSKVGTTIVIKNTEQNYNGVFLTISDSFDSTNLITNHEEGFSTYLYDNVFVDTREIDDGSSWGYWTSDFTNLSSINNLKSTWVSGNKVTPADNYSASFKGQVIGSSSDGEAILLNSNNKFEATINIGSGTITKSLIQFSTANAYWNGAFNTNTNVTKNGFSSNITGTVNYGEESSSFTNTSNLSGSYYGKNGSVQSIGGNFNIEADGITANGVFKAREVLP